MCEDAVAAATAKFNLEMPVDETGGGPDALADDGGIPLTQPEKDLPDQPDQQVGHASQIARWCSFQKGSTHRDINASD